MLQHIMYIGTCIEEYMFTIMQGLKLIMTKNTSAPLPHIKSLKGSCSRNRTIIFTIHKKMSPVMILDLLIKKYRRVQESPSTLNIYQLMLSLLWLIALLIFVSLGTDIYKLSINRRSSST